MIKYTKEQQNAIDYFDSDLLISASAGSGKTQVLLEKVLKLLERGIKLDEILMVTFTNLAASEMKSKLENMISNKFATSTYADSLFDALKQINSCDISTLHSFCQKLVKQYYYILNIEPSFEIKDEAFISYLKNLAINNTIKYYLDSNDEEFIKISNLFVHKRDYSIFKEEVLKFYEFLTSKLDKYEFCTQMIKSNYNTNLNENVLITTYKNFVVKRIVSFKEELRDLLICAEKINSTKLIEIINVFNSKLVDDFKDNIDFIKYIMNKVEFPQVRISSRAEIEEIELKERTQETAKKIKKFLSSVNEIYDIESLECLIVDIKESEKVLNKFLEIIKTFECKFKEFKKLNNCLDFNDLEELTLKLFENENVLNEVAKKYKYIFVDEYQDTNLVQEEILTLISKYAKRIMVGDIKQSIYAFRQCNPKIFSDKLEIFSSGIYGKVIELNKNFRSNKNILDFSNTIFSNLMRKSNCDYSYKDNGKFIAGAEDNEKIINNVEVLCIDKDSEIENNNRENVLILNTINNLIQQKVIENNTERHLDFKDIAIISRKRNGKIVELCNFLDKFNVPYNVKYYEQIYQSFEVKLILAYLNVLNNLDNDISLYSVLKNIYNFTTNELITIKTTTLKDAVLNYNKKDAIFEKIKVFLRDYSSYKQLLGEISVKDLVGNLIEELGLDLLLIKTFGKISNEKIKIFLQSIPSSIFNLSDFLIYAKDIEDKKFEVKKIISENSITIDTFHATKGLEYNAVIIINAGDTIFAKNASNLIYNAKFGIGIYKFDEENKTKSPNVIFSMIQQLNKQEEFNEEVRLSYVAFTRAKNYMTIIGKEKLSHLHDESNPLRFLDFNSYLSLIFSSNFINDNIKLTILTGDEKIFELDSLNECQEFQNLNLDYSTYNDIINKEYKYNNSTILQLKNSVTSISEEDKSIFNISNFKLSDLDKEDYIEIGNSYHKALELLPFNLKTISEVRNKIINLIENNILPENIYSYIEDEKVLKANQAISKLIDINDNVFKEQVFMVYMPYNEIKGGDIDDKILVQGIIDIFIEKENEIILIDYKTSRLNSLDVVKKYDIQLSLYEKALKEKYRNKKITKYIYSIFLDKLINIV